MSAFFTDKLSYLLKNEKCYTIDVNLLVGVDEPVAFFELDTRNVSNEKSTIKFEMDKEEVKNMIDTLEQIKQKFDEVLSKW